MLDQEDDTVHQVADSDPDEDQLLNDDDKAALDDVVDEIDNFGSAADAVQE